jgi:tRNA modification GTPase
MTHREPTIVACATAVGGESGLIRISGPQAVVIAQRAGITLVSPWQAAAADWGLAGGRCPCRVVLANGPRSFTGFDLIEITLPGSADLIAIALDALATAGAEPAMPGAFARQALANGRLTLDRAEALLAVAQAGDATAASQAIARLRGALGTDLTQVRTRLIDARAAVEAGLDFVDEADVRSYDPVRLRALLAELRIVLARWRVTADTHEGDPVVCLVGPANAGKSALFNRLTGATALVSPVAGTTRDWLDAAWMVGGRRTRLIDTAGWLDGARDLDATGIAAGRQATAAPAMVLACSAPDARLPHDASLPNDTVVIATKADLDASPDPRAVLAVSATSGDGIAQLAGLVQDRLGAIGAGEPRQQRLLAETDALLVGLVARLPGDELLADDLRRASDLLGDLLGVTTTDDVLDAIFSRFCIGK